MGIRITITILLIGTLAKAQMSPITDIMDVSSNGSSPKVVMGKTGDVLVTWYSDSVVYGQAFDRAGLKKGQLLQLNLSPAASYDISADSMGRKILVWDRNGSLFGQWLAADHVKEGAVFQLNADSVKGCYAPKVDMNNKGEFVVIWYAPGASISQKSSLVYVKKWTKMSQVLLPDLLVSYFSSPTVEYLNQNPAIGLNEFGDALLYWNTTYASTPRYIPSNAHFALLHGNNLIPTTGNISGHAGPVEISAFVNSFFVAQETHDYNYGITNSYENLSKVNSNGNFTSVSINLNSPYFVYNSRNPYVSVNDKGQLQYVWSGAGRGLNTPADDNIFLTSFDTNLVYSQPYASLAPLNYFNLNGGGQVVVSDYEDSLFVAAWQNGNLIQCRFYTTDGEVITGLGSTDFQAESVFVSPNPSSTLLHVHYSNEIEEIVLRNSEGQVVLSSRNKQFFIAALPAGLYLAELSTTDGKHLTTKVIKQ